MKRRSDVSLSLMLVSAFILLVLSTAVPAAAQSGDLRTELASVYAQLVEVADAYPAELPVGFADRAAEAQEGVFALSEEDLDMLGEALLAAPGWQLVPAVLESALEQQSGAPAGAALASSSGCPGGLPGDIMDYYIAKDVAQVAKVVAQGLKLVMAFVPQDLVTAGFTISAHPAKMLLQVGIEAAETAACLADSAALVLEQIYFVDEECEINAHRELLSQHDADITADLSEHDEDMKAALSQHDADITAMVSQHDADMKAALSQHDADMKDALSQHDADMKAALSQHDADIKAQVSQHDADIKAQVSQHDTDIKARLDQIDNQLVIMDAKLEYIMQLLITPEGLRAGWPHDPRK